MEGWPDQPDSDQELAPYVQRRLELGVEGGCLLWGCRVVVPPRGRKRALQMLHESHPGMVRMKALARSYMWWPGMDKEIEQHVKQCSDCQTTRKDPPPVPLHPWTWPEKPWSRIHIDYAGPMEGKMFLLMMDAHSKWMEVHSTNSATSTATIELLRKSFATLGLPEVVVSDNATAFTSSEFVEFLKRNGIRHVRTPPYHPSVKWPCRESRTDLQGGVQTTTGWINQYTDITISFQIPSGTPFIHGGFPSRTNVWTEIAFPVRPNPTKFWGKSSSVSGPAETESRQAVQKHIFYSKPAGLCEKLRTGPEVATRCGC